ncbi:MAG: radical SAM protein [Nanoarchaeota archaeon]
MITILDAYSDEPSGLGVPPYLGTYPRYLYGELASQKPNYLTIDDLRNALSERKKNPHKTDIGIANLTRTKEESLRILKDTETLYVTGGVHTPGKYLSANPASMGELSRLLPNINAEKILVGPAARGTQFQGGKKAEKPLALFNEVDAEFGEKSFDKIEQQAIPGAALLKQIPYPVIVEIETGRGCLRAKHCSFCTEGLKKISYRDSKDILNELGALREAGVQHIRFGKQADFYSYKYHRPLEIEKILKGASQLGFKTIHIDNADPNFVMGKHGEKITELIVKYCTSGNVGAFGVESFDPAVQQQNMLNASNDMIMDAIRRINEFGAVTGENGMPTFLPGINLIFGLKGESRASGELNMQYLRQIMKENLFLRRINIRQVVKYPGTPLFDEQYKVKTKRYYWKWRREIRTEIDHLMLERIVPAGTIMKDVRMEVHDGNNTFGRQFGTYPLVVGVKEKLDIQKAYTLEITGHMLRSLVGKVIL